MTGGELILYELCEHFLLIKLKLWEWKTMENVILRYIMKISRASY